MIQSPIANPTQPYWLSEPHRLASFRSTDRVPEEIGIVIIGTGMAGVGTAYHILDECKSQEKPSIAILEARDACSGATGRNGGHIKANLSAAKRCYEQLGAEEAAKILSWVAEQRRAVHKVAQKENIDCQLLATKTFDIYYDEKHAAEMRGWLQDRRKEGVDWLDDIQWLEGPYLDRITGTRRGVAGTIGSAVSLWPYKFVLGLLAIVVDKGAKLYTNTPVHKVDHTSADLVIISTSRGDIKAKKVVYATNGYTQGLLPQYKDIIAPIIGQNSRIVPNETTLRHSPNFAGTFNLHHSATAVDYLNPRPDGSITHGGGSRNFRRDGNDHNAKWFNNVDDSKLIDDAVTKDFESIDRRFLYGWEESEAKADSVWTGVMGYTPDGFPHMGRVPGSQNEWILAGFNGGGMAIIFTATKEIADMVLRGKEFEETRLPKQMKTTKERLDAPYTDARLTKGVADELAINLHIQK